MFGFMLDAVRVHAMPPASEIDGSMTLPRSFQLQLKLLPKLVRWEAGQISS